MIESLITNKVSNVRKTLKAHLDWVYVVYVENTKS